MKSVNKIFTSFFSLLFERLKIVMNKTLIFIYRPNIFIEYIKISPSILIEGTPMYLRIKQVGCYKIEIKGIGIFSGKRKIIKIQTPLTGKLEVKLYGRKQILTKKITFKVVSFQEIQAPKKVEVKPFTLLQKEHFNNLKRSNLVTGIKSFESHLNPKLDSKYLNIDPLLDLKKINLKIDQSIIQNYEKSIL
jgi:hypothetical protein